MPSILFLQFLSILAVGTGSLYAASRWKAHPPKPGWANDYFLYLLFFLMTAFVFRFVPHVIEAMLRDATAFSKAYSILAHYLVLPLSFLYLLFFIRFAAGFAGLKVSVRFQRIYVAFAALIYLVLSARAVEALKIRPAGLFARPFAIINLLILAGLFLMPVLMAIRSRMIEDPSERRSIRLFAAVHILCLGAYEVFVLASGTDVEFGQQLSRFALNVPPLLILALLTKQQISAPPRPEEARINPKVLSGRFGITGREQDIIRLVCLGKSNAEIEKELFISVKTVKRHLYNIYQKMGVKNRVQLVNLTRNSGPDAASPAKNGSP